MPLDPTKKLDTSSRFSHNDVSNVNLKCMICFATWKMALQSHYLLASSTATATATEAPTMGLLPIWTWQEKPESDKSI